MSLKNSEPGGLVEIGSLKAQKRQESIKLIKKDWELYALLILPLVYYVVFQYGPIFGNIIAFRRYFVGGPILGTDWVGFKYFKMFLKDPDFWRVFRNTFVLSLGQLIFGFPFPIIFALLLNELRNALFKRFVQTVSYLPHFLSIVIVASMIAEILSPSTGIINNIIKSLGGKPIAFLQDPGWFRPIYIISGIWQGMGWGAIIYLAALSNIDPQLYEAAEIDGANRIRQTWHVTLPGIAPTIIILLILRIGQLMSVGFQKVLLLYNPLTYETADVIGTYVYRIGLEMNNFSYATAIGLFESIIGMTLIVIANTISKRVSETSLW